MPIKILAEQKRTYEVGRVRIGAQVPVANKPGKTRPAKLAAFRFTSRDEAAIRAAAALYGGEPHRWEGAQTDDQWEVFTTAREIDVTVPPGPQSVSQWMEMWSGGGCARRCDGERDQISDGPCLCPSDPDVRAERAARGEACKPTTRVSLVLHDIPGLGVWRLESHGWNAAHELGATAEFLAKVRESGTWVSAVLRLEKRRQVSRGKTREFAVPVLTLRQTLRQMLESPAGGIALPPAPARLLAIEAAPSADAASGGQAAVPVDVNVPPCTAQEMATRVEACTDLQELRGRLARHANGKEWMDEFVQSRYAPKKDESIELREVFRARDAELMEGADRG